MKKMQTKDWLTLIHLLQEKPKASYNVLLKNHPTNSKQVMFQSDQANSPTIPTLKDYFMYNISNHPYN